jgi:hypothetical protein
MNATPKLPLIVRAAALAVVLGALAPRPARAGLDTVNPGVTLSYTFGRGLTWGLEVSWVRMPDTLDEFKEQPFGWGVAFDLSTNWRDFTKLRLGGEWVGPFIGLEAGPALVFDSRGTHVGIGVTPWAGYHVMPYYTYTYLFGEERNLHEVGTYLKLYLDPSGQGANGSSGDDWDD